MKSELKIFCTTNYFVLWLGLEKPSTWYKDFTCIVDADHHGKIYRFEIFVYEENKINYALIQKQFSSDAMITANDDGLVYITLRPGLEKRGSGFGRSADIGISTEGNLSAVQFLWNELGASIPSVDPMLALDGLSYVENSPPFDLSV